MIDKTRLIAILAERLNMPATLFERAESAGEVLQQARIIISWRKSQNDDTE